jgi:hypothetical protein
MIAAYPFGADGIIISPSNGSIVLLLSLCEHQHLMCRHAKCSMPGIDPRRMYKLLVYSVTERDEGHA